MTATTNTKQWKRLATALVYAAGTAIAAYALVVLLFSLPFMQSTLADWTSRTLSDKLKSEVSVKSVSLGFLNRVIADDVVIHDPEGGTFGSVARVSASLNLFSLLAGRVNISSAQLFGARVRLWQETSESAPNYQFIIDALADTTDTKQGALNLRMGSLIVRHCNVSYDLRSAEKKPRGTFDPHHWAILDAGMNLSLRNLTDQSADVSVRRLHATEEWSAIAIHDSKFAIKADSQRIEVKDLALHLPHSSIITDSLVISCISSSFKRFSAAQTTIWGTVTPADFSPFLPQLAHISTPLDFRIEMGGDQDRLAIQTLTIKAEDAFLVNAAAELTNVWDTTARKLRADIRSLQGKGETLKHFCTPWLGDEETGDIIQKVDVHSFAGTIDCEPAKGFMSNGMLATSVGQATYDLSLSDKKQLRVELETDSLNMGELTENEQFGNTSFVVSADVNLAEAHNKIPSGNVRAQVTSLTFNGHEYKDIEVVAHRSHAHTEGVFRMDDEHGRLRADIRHSDGEQEYLDVDVDIEELDANALHLIQSFPDENVSLQASARLHFDRKQPYGTIRVEDVRYRTPVDTYDLSHFDISAEKAEDDYLYQVDSDVLTASVRGTAAIPDFISRLTSYLSSQEGRTSANEQKWTGDFSAFLTDSPLLRHLTGCDCELLSPASLTGQVRSADETMTLRLDAPLVAFGGRLYHNVALDCTGAANGLRVNGTSRITTINERADDKPTTTDLSVSAHVANRVIDGEIGVQTQGAKNIHASILPTIAFRDSLGATRTDISLRPSKVVINDTVWSVAPSRLSLYKNEIECGHVSISSDAGNSLTINGRSSDNPRDSLVATLRNLEISYILSLTDFDAVKFAGKASGTAVIKNVYGKVPDIRAALSVTDFTLQNGPLGNANLTARWDETENGISVDGRFVDLYKMPDGLSGRERSVTGITTVRGWVSPARNDIHLDINTLRTNAQFIHGFLPEVFKEINGSVSGELAIVGPLNNVNIVGDAVPDITLRLRATNVPYHAKGDTIRLRPYTFRFDGIGLNDRFGNRTEVNGTVTHRNMKNFTYRFNARLNEALVYDEKEFNRDKFMATVFANGTVSINGSDGHPLYVDASVTPTKGSYFAYDSATPDAITGNSFIEFHDRNQSVPETTPTFAPDIVAAEPVTDSLTIVNEAKKNYNSDIFVNFDINVNPDCEVSLRMDNIDDGYMRTFGSGKLSARWHNKGSFQLFGNYNIESGSYRLYLQNIIFRDLSIQPGSAVAFNGNPFDADIHLICHHTVNSVPLSDLTNTTAFSQNNKVKVVCVLDITGKLGNMDFAFDMDLPGVSEETRQLARSMINSDEEMNTQMIYLLGFGRFYPTEYARANGGDNSGQAVNSLLSSTLSGQINQLLSNVVGNDGNWNFGTSLTTGERGWDELDAEGLLEGRLFDERLLINGAFGYRDNALTNKANFIGDFEVKWRLKPGGNLYVKAYNQTNDRYFTKATLNTQGVGLSWRHDFERLFRRYKQK